MSKKEFSYVVLNTTGKLEEIQGVYLPISAACYGANFVLANNLFPKHGDEVKIIRCEIISTAEAKTRLFDVTKKEDIFEKCEDDFCSMPTPNTQEVS